jgi:large subunit ribosomal protein L29
MKAKDLRERTPDDLKELEKSLAKDTFTARFKNFTNRLDDTSTINKTKRDLARVKTLIRQAELNAAGPKGSGDAPKAEAKAAAASPARAPSTKKTAAKTASKSEAK